MSRAVETFQVVHSAVTGTATGSAIPVDGTTVGSVQVDDAGSGTFTIVVNARIDSTAEWQTLNVIKQDNTRSGSITAEGIYDIHVFGKTDVQINITDNTGATALTVWMGLNS